MWTKRKQTMRQTKWIWSGRLHTHTHTHRKKADNIRKQYINASWKRAQHPTLIIHHLARMHVCDVKRVITRNQLKTTFSLCMCGIISKFISLVFFFGGGGSSWITKKCLSTQKKSQEYTYHDKKILSAVLPMTYLNCDINH